MDTRVPNIVVGRLPIYLRSLEHLAEQGHGIISSHQLAALLGTSAAQIRKDLSHFGEFGKQGTGYHIPYLIVQLKRILKADQEWEVALVGVGDIGHALLRNRDLPRRGFRIVAAFDSDRDKVGTRFGQVTVHELEQLAQVIQGQGIQLAIVAVPPAAAQTVTDALVAAGIRGVLNYSPIAVSVPDHVRLQQIDPVTHLQHMTYYG